MIFLLESTKSPPKFFPPPRYTSQYGCPKSGGLARGWVLFIILFSSLNLLFRIGAAIAVGIVLLWIYVIRPKKAQKGEDPTIETPLLVAKTEQHLYTNAIVDAQPSAEF
ncbi:hypothetical protein BLNAU_22000 [Blattamonas nauphoetae]|uniref:Uncharacterized protein n=1 Tax=Blattamonas nauphoetae TaxID=2049346 RepID=A0ABQ9WXE4_9EUKA|nr:hypothetical protein BLNAU_22000 [Blattamonas nauphoetae]